MMLVSMPQLGSLALGGDPCQPKILLLVTFPEHQGS